jgi:DNA-binding GntR family transcriptional regulator
VTGEIGPEYRRLMESIRSRIATGEYPTGSQIPSTAQWEADGWSRDTVRTAITRLQADGILVGQPGKGVFVKATPEQVASERVSLESLTLEISALRDQLRELSERETGSPDLKEILARVGRIEDNLVDLYGKTGYDYPQPGGSRDDAKAAAGRGRAHR